MPISRAAQAAIEGEAIGRILLIIKDTQTRCVAAAVALSALRVCPGVTDAVYLNFRGTMLTVAELVEEHHPMGGTSIVHCSTATPGAAV